MARRYPAARIVIAEVIRFVLVLSLFGCVSHRKSDRLRLDDLLTLKPGPLPTDSAVLARLGREHPCVSRVPRLSRFSESLSKPVLCTLYETAVDAIRDLNAATPEVLPDLRQAARRELTK